MNSSIILNRVIVLKFGGTSLRDLAHVRAAAQIVIERHRHGYQVVVVVSARSGVTDQLLRDAGEVTDAPAPREMDMLLSTGERASAALFSIVLNAAGAPAICLTGSQAGIITDDNHTNARIIELRPYRVARALEAGSIVVVGGFQGVSFQKEVTTLGRGGSDVTAVALASALDAEKCEIFSDVDGIYSADPRLVDNPKRLSVISYQEMQEMAEAGAKVLHPKSIEFAKIKKTLVHARATLEPGGMGTIIQNLEGRIKPRIIGVASEEKIIFVVFRDPAESRLSNRLIEFCDQNQLQTKQLTFHQTGGRTGSLIIPEKLNYQLPSLLARVQELFGETLQAVKECSTVSLIGAGINERYETLLAALQSLEAINVEVIACHTSSFRISLVVARADLTPAVRQLYKRFIESPLTEG